MSGAGGGLVFVSSASILLQQASLDGTHPHQWTPPSVHDYFIFDNGGFGDFPRACVFLPLPLCIVRSI